MKKLALQISMVILATYSVMFTKPQSASAQVDMSLLTDVAKSCQKDTTSSEYYKQMGFDDEKIQSVIGLGESLGTCIRARYRHSLLQSKFPWLASTGEMVPGYPGSVAVSLIAHSGYISGGLDNSSLLDCIVSQDPSNDRCISSIEIFYDDKIRSNVLNRQSTYVCPSCVVAHDNVMSAKRMRGSFIQWFLNLDKPTRRKVMSILGEGQKAANNRSEIIIEAIRALDEYKATRQKVEQQEQERRRREVIGN